MKIRLIIDKILTIICLFIPSYLLLNFLTDNIAVKIALSCLISILGLAIISLWHKVNSKRINYKNFELYVNVHGADYIYDKLLKVFENMQFERQGDYLISPQKVMIIASVKFGSVSPDEVIKHNRTALSNGAEKCYLIAKELPKNAALAIFNFAPKLKFIPLKIVYKLLKSHGLLSEKMHIALGKLNYSPSIFDVVFSKNNLKKFLFVAVILLLFSFIIPFKIYYIVLGGINIVFAVICLVRGKTNTANGQYEIFDKRKQ